MGIENAKTGLYGDMVFSLYEGRGWDIVHNFTDPFEADSGSFNNSLKWGWLLTPNVLENKKLTIPLELML